MTTEPPPVEHDAGRADQPGSLTRCVECLEPIARGAKRCPECGAAQQPPGLAGRLLKAASAIVALITFVLGLHQLTNMAIERIARGSNVESTLVVAKALLGHREYPAAWKSLERMEGSEAQAMRQTLARHWLLDANTLASGMKLGEIAERVAPAIAPATTSGDSRRRADYQALLAYAQLLRARDEPVASDFRGLFEAALSEDDQSAVAHMLYGHFLLSVENELESGLAHLTRAVALERVQRESAFSVRGFQLSALTNYLHTARGRSRDPANPEWQARIALLHIANELRTRNEPVPDRTASASIEARPGHYWRQLAEAYEVRDADALARLRQALPAREHLALLEWLEVNRAGGRNRPTRSYVAALLHEDLGKPEAAVAALNASDTDYVLASSFDALHRRLTGEPFGPLSRRDPWAHRAQVFARAEYDTDEFAEASEALDEYMGMHWRGSGRNDAQALPAISSARQALAAKAAQDEDLADDDREFDRRLALYHGKLLMAGGEQTQASATLKRLVDDLPSGHELRGSALVELAAVLAASSEGDDLATAVARLAEAVEQEGWSDWAWIRWRPVLRSLHARADYAALLNRHGRRPGPPAGVGVTDER